MTSPASVASGHDQSGNTTSPSRSNLIRKLLAWERLTKLARCRDSGSPNFFRTYAKIDETCGLLNTIKRTPIGQTSHLRVHAVGTNNIRTPTITNTIPKNV
jgi:hypothetical protein